MVSATKMTAALVAGAAILGAAHIATAEESGSLRLIRTYVQDYTTIEHGDARYTGGSLEGSVTILESSGGPFVVGTHERITCVVHAKSTEAGIDLDAPCTMTAPLGRHVVHPLETARGQRRDGRRRPRHHGDPGRHRRLRWH